MTLTMKDAFVSLDIQDLNVNLKNVSITVISIELVNSIEAVNATKAGKDKIVQLDSLLTES